MIEESNRFNVFMNNKECIRILGIISEVINVTVEVTSVCMQTQW